MTSGKDFLKSQVLSWRRKVCSDWELRLEMLQLLVGRSRFLEWRHTFTAWHHTKCDANKADVVSFTGSRTWHHCVCAVILQQYIFTWYVSSLVEGASHVLHDMRRTMLQAMLRCCRCCSPACTHCHICCHVPVNPRSLWWLMQLWCFRKLFIKTVPILFRVV